MELAKVERAVIDGEANVFAARYTNTGVIVGATTGQQGLEPMRYQPIENHGIVGNMHSAALVGLDGSVDWLCLPRFDSPSVFGAILDADKGGRFRIAPAADGELRRKQFY